MAARPGTGLGSSDLRGGRAPHAAGSLVLGRALPAQQAALLHGGHGAHDHPVQPDHAGAAGGPAALLRLRARVDAPGDRAGEGVGRTPLAPVPDQAESCDRNTACDHGAASAAELTSPGLPRLVLISSIAACSGPLTAIPSSRWALATLSASATTNRR